MHSDAHSQSTDKRTPAKDKKAAGAFRTISEVADELEVQQHVLRFWETKFSQVKPLKRGGGRRYYRPEDVDVLKKIHKLLYTDGYTIRGAQNLIKGMSKNQVGSLKMKKPVIEQENDASVAGHPQNPTSDSEVISAKAQPSVEPQPDHSRMALKEMVNELKVLREMLK